MRENLLRTLWQQDAYAVNGWLSLPATFSAEVMAHQGWDSLTIDLQHGLIDYQVAVGILQAISTTSKRMAFNRLSSGDQLPPLNWSDFEMAVKRVRGQ